MELKTAIDNVKQAKVLLSDANNIMSANVSQLKNIESENAKLRHEIFDKRMELPLDADGEPIHIGDVLYSSGNECRVVGITVKADEACVGVHTDEGVFLPSVNPKYLSRKNPEPLEPEPADSWERIADDIESYYKAHAFINQSTLDEFADRIRKLAKKEC